MNIEKGKIYYSDTGKLSSWVHYFYVRNIDKLIYTVDVIARHKKGNDVALTFNLKIDGQHNDSKLFGDHIIRAINDKKLIRLIFKDNK